MNEEFDLIQRGESKHCMCAPLMNAEDGVFIPMDTEQYLFSLEVEESKSKRKNGKWNRDPLFDFSLLNTVKSCIGYTFVKYGSFGSNYGWLLMDGYQKRLSDEGINRIYDTLKEWGMNSRGAKLTKFDAFKQSIQMNKNLLDKLCDYSLLDFCDNTKSAQIKNILLNLFDNLNLSQSNPFVTNAKTLHIIIPQLLIPVDRTFTVGYFCDYKFSDVPKDTKEQVDWIMSIHSLLANVYIKHKDWIDDYSLEANCPITKLLDNMVMGFSLYRNAYINEFSASLISDHWK